MRSRSTRVVLLLTLFVFVAALAAGCGGSSKSSSSGTTTAPPATTTEATTTMKESTSTVKAGSVADCKTLATLGVQFEHAMAAAGGPTGNASVDVKKSAQLFQKFADSVPSSVRPDFQVLAKAFSDYANVVAGVHLTPGKVPSPSDIAKLTNAAKVFNSSKLRTAEANLSAWAAKSCPQVNFPSGQ